MPKINRIEAAFGMGLQQALDWAAAQEGLRGIILNTAHGDFCVGADLESLFPERGARALLERVQHLGALYRRLETMGVPVVASLTGSARGGGYELALACHHRIALDDARVQVGLPEVPLSVLPGAGGTQRLPRWIGIQAALDIILQGKLLRATKAKATGLVDVLATGHDALRQSALDFVAANPGAGQPWDRKGWMPGPCSPSGTANATRSRGRSRRWPTTEIHSSRASSGSNPITLRRMSGRRREIRRPCPRPPSSDRQRRDRCCSTRETQPSAPGSSTPTCTPRLARSE